MKEIKAIIHPHMAQKVIHALRELEHFPGFTLLDGRGEGRGLGAGGAYAATEDAIENGTSRRRDPHREELRRGDSNPHGRKRRHRCIGEHHA